MNSYYIFFALLAGALCICFLGWGDNNPGIATDTAIDMPRAARGTELVTIGKIEITQPVVIGADIINFVDTNGRIVISICMRSGTIAHSFADMGEAGKAAADIFWSSFAAQLRAHISADQD